VGGSTYSGPVSGCWAVSSSQQTESAESLILKVSTARPTAANRLARRGRHSGGQQWSTGRDSVLEEWGNVLMRAGGQGGTQWHTSHSSGSCDGRDGRPAPQRQQPKSIDFVTPSTRLKSFAALLWPRLDEGAACRACSQNVQSDVARWYGQHCTPAARGWPCAAGGGSCVLCSDAICWAHPHTRACPPPLPHVGCWKGRVALRPSSASGTMSLSSLRCRLCCSVAQGCRVCCGRVGGFPCCLERHQSNHTEHHACTTTAGGVPLSITVRVPSYRYPTNHERAGVPLNACPKGREAWYERTCATTWCECACIVHHGLKRTRSFWGGAVGHREHDVHWAPVLVVAALRHQRDVGFVLCFDCRSVVGCSGPCARRWWHSMVGAEAVRHAKSTTLC
jgi:hypothetical protein